MVRTRCARRAGWRWGMAALLALITAGLCPAQDDALGDTGRDAYLRGWMLEHADGDFEGALKAYDVCFERARAEQPLLAARARVRAARIALARGDDVACAALSQQAIDLAPGSEMAAEAEALMASQAETEDASVEAVREDVQRAIDLMEEYAAANRSLSVGMDAVLDALSSREILATCERLGVSSSVLFHWEPSDAKAARLLPIAMGASEPWVGELCKRMAVVGDQPPPIAFTLMDDPSERFLDAALYLLLPHHDERSMAAVRVLLERDPSLPAKGLFSEVSGRVLRWLGEHPSPLAADILRTHATALDPELHGEPWGAAWKNANQHRNAHMNGPSSRGHGAADAFLLALKTPTGDAYRELYTRLPVAVRAEIARVLREVARVSIGDDAWAVLEADPEPHIRRLAVELRASLGDVHALPAGVVRGLPDILRRQLLETLVRDDENVIPFDALLSMTADSTDREAVCILALSGSLRLPVRAESSRRTWSVIEQALELDPQALVGAIFRQRPPFANVSESTRSQARSMVQRACELDAASPAVNQTVAKLIDAGMASPDASMREAVIREASGWPAGLTPPSLAARALADSCPRVRSQALRSLDLADVPDDVLRGLLVDGSPWVFRYGADRIPRSSVLASAASGLSPSRLRLLWSAASDRGDFEVLRAIYRAPQQSSLERLQRFEVLAQSDLAIALDGLASDEQAIADLAWTRLATPLHRDNPDLFARCLHLAGTAERAALLREEMDLVQRAFRRDRIEHLTRQIETNAPNRSDVARPVVTRAVEELAALGARDVLHLLAKDEFSEVRKAGWSGLQRLGDVEAIRRHLWDADTPSEVLPYALSLGLLSDGLALVKEGRLDAWTLLKGVLEAPPGVVVSAELLRATVDGRFPASAWGPKQLVAAVGAWVDAGASNDQLAQVIKLTGSETALRELVRREAWNVILDGVRSWPSRAQGELTGLLFERTEHPALFRGGVSWPIYIEEQDALVEAWRGALSDG